MNELIVKETKIEDMIYEIRGKQVMLDFDLAKLYDYYNEDNISLNELYSFS